MMLKQPATSAKQITGETEKHKRYKSFSPSPIHLSQYPHQDPDSITHTTLVHIKMQLSSIVFFISSAAALGINCRGSGVCSFNDASLQVVHDQIGNLIAGGGGDRRFNTGRK